MAAHYRGFEVGTLHRARSHSEVDVRRLRWNGRRMQNRRLARALTLCLALLAFGCSDNDDDGANIDPDTPFPHSIPTTNSMSVDVSDLDSGKGDHLAALGVCHAGAAIAVIWINANVAVRLAIPTATFAACIQEDPVYVGDQTWRWTATGQSQGTPWTAELSGTIVGPSTVGWAMRISGTTLDLDRFLWFDGQADANATAGVWHYYDPLADDRTDETVRIDWLLPPVGTADQVVIFENRIEGTPEFGDGLRYVYTGSAFTLELDDVSEGGRATIEWNQTTGAGSFTPIEGEQCCWGERPTFPDVTCP